MTVPRVCAVPTRFNGPGALCHDKMYDVIVAISKAADSKFMLPKNESCFDMANPLRACFSPDVTVQFDRRDLYRLLIDGKIANRCQKPVSHLRWAFVTCGPPGAIVAIGPPRRLALQKPFSGPSGQ